MSYSDLEVQAVRDAARLDWLEKMGNEPEGLLLHSQQKPTNRLGLGLACTGRSIRVAIDQAMGADSEANTFSEPK
jgi:hypothetical protein